MKPEAVEWCIWTGYNIDEIMRLGSGHWALSVSYPDLSLRTIDGEVIAYKEDYVVYRPRTQRLERYSEQTFRELFRAYEASILHALDAD